jgi:type II secretory pathway pseudopilin PulG
MKALAPDAGWSLAAAEDDITCGRAASTASTVPSGGRRANAGAFSLVEVVAAIGVLAVAVVAVLGLLAAIARSAREVADAHLAARLGENIQGELERLRAGLGLDGLAAVIPPAGSTAPLQLAATRDGLRVLRADGAPAPADRPLNDSTLPGIALRDRYYLIEVTQQLDLPYAPDAGFLAVSVRVAWPHRLPVGPPTPDATAVDADSAREVPRNERNWMVLNIALRP